MNTKEIVKNLASERRLTIAELERKLNIANGTIGKWDKQNPSVEPLTKLADFFNVSIDFLLGIEKRNIDDESIDVKDLFKKANSFNGKPISDHDKLVAKQLLDAYFETKQDE